MTPFSNKAIVEKLLPRVSEAVGRMLQKHIRLSDDQYIRKQTYKALDDAHAEAFKKELAGPFRALMKEVYPKYLEALYSAFDKMEATVEGEGATREREERCNEFSLWLARYIAENPAHGEDEAFLDIIAEEMTGKFLGGLPRLDLEIVLDTIAGNMQDYMNLAFKEKFGMAQDEIGIEDIEEIFKEKAKKIPEEK